QLQRGVVHELLDMNIHRSRHMAQTVCDLLSDEIVLGVVRAAELNINGRRQAKVQNLTDNIGRLEEEFHSWKLTRQGFTKLVNVLVGWTMAARQVHQHFGI